MNDPATPMVDGAGFGPGTYGRSFADVYDEWYPDVSDARATAAFLAAFGQGQRVLELGVGTGRLASAFVADGHRVIGVDAARAMLDRLMARSRGIEAERDIGAIEADMAALPFAAGCVDTVVVATNTLFNLDTADRQQACLTEAARCLAPGGRVVAEAFVPPAPDPTLDRLVSTKAVEIDRVVLTATIRDDETQTITGQHVEITATGTRLRPWRIRYASPAELDDLARRAGLRLTGRYGDWHHSPFDATSTRHVSVYALS